MISRSNDQVLEEESGMCSKKKAAWPMSAEFKRPKLKICYPNFKQMVTGKKKTRATEDCSFSHYNQG